MIFIKVVLMIPALDPFLPPAVLPHDDTTLVQSTACICVPVAYACQQLVSSSLSLMLGRQLSALWCLADLRPTSAALSTVL